MTDADSGTAAIAPETRRARMLYRGAVISYMALILLLMAWLLWLAPPPPALRSPMLLLLGLPLLLGLRGVLQGRRYTLQWTAMLSLVYFIHGVLAAAGPAPERWLGSAEVALALAYFGLALLHLRSAPRRGGGNGC